MDVKTLYTEFYWYYIKTRLKPNTQRGYRVNIEKHYLPFVGELELYDINCHTYATAMMLARVNPKIVSEALGHSGIGITLDLYSHPDVSMQQQLLDVITEKRT